MSDTSPVRALAFLGRLGLLSDLFGRVLVPPAVLRELEHPEHSAAPVTRASLPMIDVRAPSDASVVEALTVRLHRGEAEAIALALELPGSLLLIDELPGRAAARSRNVPVIGTLGVLLRAKEEGRVAAVRPLLAALRDDLGFFIHGELFEQLLRDAGEDAPPLPPPPPPGA